MIKIEIKQVYRKTTVQNKQIDNSPESNQIHVE